MMLLTKEIRKRLPPLYSTEKDPDPIIRVKFFNPCGAGTWYVLEGELSPDPDYPPGDYLFFGLCDIHEKELGYFNLKELESVRLRFGLRIERDLHFGEKPLSKVFPERYPLKPEAAQEPGTIGAEIETLLIGGPNG